MIYEGTTNFGFFTNETMEQQVGIRNPEKIIYTPTADELKNARSLDFGIEAPLTPDDTDASAHSKAALPSKALLMVDGVECYIPEGGPKGLGYVRGYKTVDPDEWFFKAHFYQDPVCPGSLGVESFIQLIKFAALDRFPGLKDSHILEFVTGTTHEWLYRGQVIPRNRKVEVTAIVTGITDGDAPEITADGYLTVDGLLIYQMKNFGLRLTPAAP
jgi:3-hydroxymyristoyl/3-hydroxydecanoyl-(acyl carrier protein) dehydratase